MLDARTIVSRMQVRWLTCVKVRPAWLRACTRASPMLTPRLHYGCGAAAARECGRSGRMRAAPDVGPVTKLRPAASAL